MPKKEEKIFTENSMEKRTCWGACPTFGFLQQDASLLMSGSDWRILITMLNKTRGGQNLGTIERPLVFSTYQFMFYTRMKMSTVNKSLNHLRKLKLITWETKEKVGFIKTRGFILNMKAIYSLLASDTQGVFLDSQDCLEILRRKNLISTSEEVSESMDAELAIERRRALAEKDFAPDSNNEEENNGSSSAEDFLKEKYSDIDF